MLRINNDFWNYSPGINQAGKLFVARFLELLHPFTIDNFKVRHLNLHMVFLELKQIIQGSIEKQFETDHVEEVCKEALEILKTDPIAELILPKKNQYNESLSKPLFFNKKDHTNTRIHPGVIVLIDHIVSVLNNNYFEKLIQELNLALSSDQPKNVLPLTEALVTEAIGIGFHPNRLYWRAKGFLNPPQRPFSQRFQSFMDELIIKKPGEYTAIFRLSFKNDLQANQCPPSIGKVECVSKVKEDGINEKSKDYLKEDNKFRYAIIRELPAKDQWRAATRGFSRLSRILDLMQFANPSLEISPGKTAVIIQSGTPSFTIFFENQVLGPFELEKDAVTDVEKQFDNIINSQHLSGITQKQIRLALQYFRKGLSDPTPEGQFLALWIGVESLFGRLGPGQLSYIRKNIAILMTLEYSKRLLLDLDQNLKRCNIKLPLEIESSILNEYDKNKKLVILGDALREESSLEKLLDATKDNPLLKSRVQQTASIFITSKSLKEAIKKHLTDVDRHVFRMSRLRNAVVHGGDIPEDLTHLLFNLVAYLRISLREIMKELSTSRAHKTIHDVLYKKEWLYDNVKKNLEVAAEDNLPLIDLIFPEIFWPG